MADLKYAVELNEDEITVLIQLLNARVVELAHANADAVVTFETALKKKLLDIRHAGIVAANMAGTLKG